MITARLRLENLIKLSLIRFSVSKTLWNFIIWNIVERYPTVTDIIIKTKPPMKTAVLMKHFLSLLCIIGVMLVASSCEDEDEPEIKYPATGFYGDNILMKGKTEYTARDNSLQAKLPEGTSLKIVITGKTVNFPNGVWFYATGTANNWAVIEFDMTLYSQTFYAIDGGHTCDLQMQFDKGTFQIDYYENGATSPSATKTIVVDY